jgi:hypothetical protein
MHVMSAPDRLCETRWLQQVLSALTRFNDAKSPGQLANLRDELCRLVRSAGAPRAATFAAEGDSFRRHPLAIVEAIESSALLMYWPAGHATLPHDHGGLWGIEVVIDGTLDVDEFVRAGGADLPVLAKSRTLRLDAGDAAMFTNDRYVHRCRNLSNIAPTLTLHVYGGRLERYTSFDRDAAGVIRPKMQIAKSDRTLS